MAPVHALEVISSTPVAIPQARQQTKTIVHKAQLSERSAKASNKTKKSGGKAWTWKKRPADRPKRPLSAYNIFFQTEREKIKRSYANAPTEIKPTFSGMAKIVAAKWNKIDEVTKARFERQAALDRERHEREMRRWKLNMRIRELEAKRDEVEKELRSLREELNDPDQTNSLPQCQKQVQEPTQKMLDIEPTPLPVMGPTRRTTLPVTDCNQQLVSSIMDRDTATKLLPHVSTANMSLLSSVGNDDGRKLAAELLTLLEPVGAGFQW